MSLSIKINETDNFYGDADGSVVVGTIYRPIPGQTDDSVALTEPVGQYTGFIDPEFNGDGSGPTSFTLNLVPLKVTVTG